MTSLEKLSLKLYIGNTAAGTAFVLHDHIAEEEVFFCNVVVEDKDPPHTRKTVTKTENSCLQVVQAEYWLRGPFPLLYEELPIYADGTRAPFSVLSFGPFKLAENLETGEIGRVCNYESEFEEEYDSGAKFENRVNLEKYRAYLSTGAFLNSGGGTIGKAATQGGLEEIDVIAETSSVASMGPAGSAGGPLWGGTSRAKPSPLGADDGSSSYAVTK